MTIKAYITSIVTLIMSVWFTPDWSDLLKVYVISVVVLLTLAINLIFRIGRLREYVINHLVGAVLQELMKDPDIRRLINWKDRQERIRERLKQALDKRNAKEN